MAMPQSDSAINNANRGPQTDKTQTSSQESTNPLRAELETISTANSHPSPWLALRNRWRTSGLEAAWRFFRWWLRFGRVYKKPDAATLAQRKHAIDELVRHLAALKGPFVKFGQFISLRYDIVPALEREALSQLHDRVTPLPFASLRPSIQNELGNKLQDHFASIDQSPIGAASIAQVHRGRLRDGQEVAIKIQYPWLQAALPNDLRLLNWLLQRMVGSNNVDMQRLQTELGQRIREELDFEREANAAKRIAANLCADPQVVVPAVFPDLSSKRILTMEFHPAIPLNSRQELLDLGIPIRPALETVARAYAKQVFIDGLFHADPHPGNLFVLDDDGATNKPKILFVDFGLAEELDPQLRSELRKAVYAILQNDQTTFFAGMQRLGMIQSGFESQARQSLSSMFARLRGEGSPIALGGSSILALKDEAKQLLTETEGLQIPNELLLYAKTMSYLFALGANLDPEVDMMRLTVPYLLQFLAAKEPETTGDANAAPVGE